MVSRTSGCGGARKVYSNRMFANLVRAALAAEFLAWCALGAWLSARHGWSAAVLVAGAVGGAVLVRLALVCVSLGISWLARSARAPGEQLGLAGSAALVAGEWRAMLANNFLWLPLENSVLRADPPFRPSPRVPIVVVHGYFSNRGTLCSLVRALDAAGAGPVFAPSLPAILAPIESFAAHLERVVREVTEATGQPRVVLVCHSMGGLVARAYLRTHGPARVAALITLASPHHGTVLAALGIGTNGRQMRAGSDFLRDLARSEGESGPGVPGLSVYTVHDNLVAPQDSSRLSWARNVPVHGVAHVAMLADARVHRAVLEEVERVAGRGAA